MVVDFETFYDRKKDYDLRSISATEYIRDRRFWVHGMAYRFLDDERTHWLAGQHPIEAWAKAVDWPNTVVVAHNIRFDGAILAWRFKVKPFAWMDTVGMAKAVLGENVSGYSLKRLGEYLGLTPKGEISCDGVLHPSAEQLATLGDYCKNDVEMCKGIYEKLVGQFPQSQLSAMDWTIRAFVEPRLALDKVCLQKGVENEKKRREEIIKKSGIERDVLSSNKQFAEYLSRNGYDVPTKISARTGKPIPAFARTDDGLARLAVEAPELHAARIASKSNLLETRGEALLAVARTGPFPFDVGFSGAVQTHRYSGGGGAGGNAQNFTRQSFLREAVCPPEGHELVVGDFAAIELRLLAWLAKEPKLMGKIINDEDLYCDFASLKYGRKITKADKIERQFGKCLAEGTQVLTLSGWKNIEQISLKDKLWDGETWVTHQGLQCKGEKEVIGLNGLYLTPDHKVLCETDWKESQYLAQDKNILSRALATGLEKLPSLVMSKEFGVAWSDFCENVTAAERKILLRLPMSETVEPHDAMNVRKKPLEQQENCIGTMLPIWPMMTTVRAFLTAYRQLLVGVIIQRINNTSTMVLAESPSAKIGGEIVALSYPMSNLSLTGLYHRLKWIELTLMETMNRTTSDSYLNLQISVIKEGLKTSKTKLLVYDLLLSGPKNRFTVLTTEGPLIVHNCSILGLGYNMGAKKFKFTVKTQTGMDISEDDAWKTVSLYRETYFNVPKLWEQAHVLLPLIAEGRVGCLWFAPFIKVRKNALILPSGLQIKYPNLRSETTQGPHGPRTEWIYDVYHKVYVAEPTKLYGGKIIENICQALAGELCREAIERAEAMGLECVGQVHDEVLALSMDGPTGAARLKFAMEQPPRWMPSLRLKSEVGYGKNWNAAKV